MQLCVLRLHNRLLQEFLHHWGSDTAAETAGAVPCPNSLLYTSWVTATAHERAFYEGMWAQLPQMPPAAACALVMDGWGAAESGAESYVDVPLRPVVWAI